jgi:hypothetical protein
MVTFLAGLKELTLVVQAQADGSGSPMTNVLGRASSRPKAPTLSEK